MTERGELLADPIRFPREVPTDSEALGQIGARLIGRLPTRAQGWERPADCGATDPAPGEQS